VAPIIDLTLPINLLLATMNLADLLRYVLVGCDPEETSKQIREDQSIDV